MRDNFTPVLAEGVSALVMPDGVKEIGGYHGLGHTVQAVDEKTGEIRIRAIIIAGSMEDLKQVSSALIPAESFDANKAARVSVVGTAFLKITDEEL